MSQTHPWVCYAEWPGGDRLFHVKHLSTGLASAPEPLPITFFGGRVSIARLQNKFFFFYKFAAGTAEPHLRYQVFDPATNEWALPRSIPGGTTTESPSAVVHGDRLFVFWQEALSPQTRPVTPLPLATGALRFTSTADGAVWATAADAGLAGTVPNVAMRSSPAAAVINYTNPTGGGFGSSIMIVYRAESGMTTVPPRQFETGLATLFSSGTMGLPVGGDEICAVLKSGSGWSLPVKLTSSFTDDSPFLIEYIFRPHIYFKERGTGRLRCLRIDKSGERHDNVVMVTNNDSVVAEANTLGTPCAMIQHNHPGVMHLYYRTSGNNIFLVYYEDDKPSVVKTFLEGQAADGPTAYPVQYPG